MLRVFPLNVDTSLFGNFLIDFGHCPIIVLGAIVAAPFPNRPELIVVQIDEGEGVRLLEDRPRHQSLILGLVQLDANHAICKDEACRRLHHLHPVDGNPVIGESLFAIFVVV